MLDVFGVNVGGESAADRWTHLSLSDGARRCQRRSERRRWKPPKLFPPAGWMSGLRDEAVRGSARKARREKKLQGDATVASEPE